MFRKKSIGIFVAGLSVFLVVILGNIIYAPQAKALTDNNSGIPTLLRSFYQPPFDHDGSWPTLSARNSHGNNQCYNYASNTHFPVAGLSWMSWANNTESILYMGSEYGDRANFVERPSYPAGSVPSSVNLRLNFSSNLCRLLADQPLSNPMSPSTQLTADFYNKLGQERVYGLEPDPNPALAPPPNVVRGGVVYDSTPWNQPGEPGGCSGVCVLNDSAFSKADGVFGPLRAPQNVKYYQKKDFNNEGVNGANFTLSGLQNLPPSATPYQVRVFYRGKPVTYWPNGRPGSSGPEYVCLLGRTSGVHSSGDAYRIDGFHQWSLCNWGNYGGIIEVTIQPPPPVPPTLSFVAECSNGSIRVRGSGSDPDAPGGAFEVYLGEVGSAHFAVYSSAGFDTIINNLDVNVGHNLYLYANGNGGGGSALVYSSVPRCARDAYTCVGQGSTIRSVEVGDPINFTLSSVNSGTSTWTNGTTIGPHTFIVRVGAPAAAARNYTPATVGRGGTATTEQISYTVQNAPTTITVEWWMRFNGADMLNDTLGGTRHCTAVIKVGTRPYIKAYGGDVWSDGGVFGFARRIDDTHYRGASTQLTITALGVVSGFYSVGTRDSNLGGNTWPPRDLTFANTAALSGDDPTRSFGGLFGSSVLGLPDYFTIGRDTNLGSSSLPASLGGDSTLPNQSDRRQYTLPADSTIGGRTIPTGVQAAVFIDGDVYINGNITYATGGRNSVNDIPYFAVIVRGSIFVAPGVSRLDGLYSAQPKTDGTGGKIYTCAAGVRSLYPDNVLAGVCDDHQLSVNGSLVAREIKFLRTLGTLRDSIHGEMLANFDTGQGGTNAAETINYTAEMFAAPSPLRDPSEPLVVTGPSVGAFQSIRSLPPNF